MRINKYIAERLGISRRKADEVVSSGVVTINGSIAQPGQTITENDIVMLGNKALPEMPRHTTIMLNKPTGYVCSKDGQGSNTIYDILPIKYRTLNPVGRLDKDSSGLLLLTNDGNLHQELAHPKYQKEKIYQVRLNRSLSTEDNLRIEQGVELDDGVSALSLKRTNSNDKTWTVTMHEGRNRQIRRTFDKAGYKVTSLHRTNFGNYTLGNLPKGSFLVVG